MTFVDKCLSDTGPRSPDLQTSAPSAPTTSSLPTSSAGASPARMSLELAKELASLVLNGAYGASFGESSASSDQLGWWSKTSRLAQRSGWIPSLGTWNSSAMRRYRSRFRQLMSAHPISGAGSSLLAALYGELPRLLPTPTVKGNHAKKEHGGKSGDGLATAINRIGLLPTPTSNDSSRGDCPSERQRRNPALPTAAKLLPTPTSRDATSGPGHAATAQGSPNLRTVLLPTPTASSYGSNKGGAAGREGPERLSLEAMGKRGLLPTPCARDYKGSPGQGTKGGQSLPRALGQTRRCLNPAFVEWMMGFPPGWVELDEPSD